MEDRIHRNLSEDDMAQITGAYHAWRAMPGALRISFGFYNSKDEIDVAVDALRQIQHRKWRGHYTQDVRSGEYDPAETKTSPVGWFNI